MQSNSVDTIQFIQQSFTVNDREELLKIWGKVEQERIYAYPHHFTVYAKTHESVPLVKISSTKAIGEASMTHFGKLLNTFDRDNIWHMIFLCSVFHSNAYQSIINKNDKVHCAASINGKPISDILNASFGYLTYGFQLEWIYQMLTGRSAAEASSFRKDWNLKRPFAIREAKALQINESESLYDFIRIHNPDPNGFVYQPAFAEGLQLWRLLH